MRFFTHTIATLFLIIVTLYLIVILNFIPIISWKWSSISPSANTHHWEGVGEQATILTQHVGDRHALQVHSLQVKGVQSVLGDRGAQVMVRSGLGLGQVCQHVFGEGGGSDGRDVEVFVPKTGHWVLLGRTETWGYVTHRNTDYISVAAWQNHHFSKRWFIYDWLVISDDEYDAFFSSIIRGKYNRI